MFSSFDMQLHSDEFEYEYEQYLEYMASLYGGVPTEEEIEEMMREEFA